MQKILSVFMSVTLLACGGSADGSAADAGSTPRDGALANFEATHTFPSYALPSGDDNFGTCQSWSLGNEETIFVNSVHMTNEGAWHHSNWVYVPETSYPGPDGTWDCDSRSFSEVAGAVTAGGGVFFAQSTQATDETQQFQPGVVLAIPPHSKIIGSVHLINTTLGLVNTSLAFSLGLVEESAVTVRLSPLSYSYMDGLVVPARVESTSSMSCDLAASFRNVTHRDPDFHIYYILPHYHQLGTGMTVTVVGGPHDGEIVFENTAAIGDPLGQMFDVPFDMTGATGLRMSCHYDNPNSNDFHYANSVNGEMYLMLAYTDAPVTFGALSANPRMNGVNGGVTEYESDCGVLGLPAQH
ncbi:MAG: hypothetical protein IPK60_14920 [Sandaracinaceae bacterium]|nr:hypothetical protein [Sandaracinaceae bacterium]